MSRCRHGYKPVDGYVCAACSEEAMGQLIAEIDAVVSSIPDKYIIRVREGGGLENVPASLALSVKKLIDALPGKPSPKWVQIKFGAVECPHCKDRKFIEEKAKMEGGVDYHCLICQKRWSEPCL